MLTIGCHLSTKDGYFGMAKEIVSIGGNTFQYFTRNPRGGNQRKLDIEDVEEYLTFAKANGIETIMAYAPYDIEPASSDKSKADFALTVLLEDIKRLERIPGQNYLVRPGSAGDIDMKTALSNLIDIIDCAVDEDMSSILLLMNMPGEGTQVCYTFEQLEEVLNGVDCKDKVGVCLDPASLWAAGYDIVNDLDSVIDEIDSSIGIGKVMAIHLNDSKESLGSKVDRHARIGEGKIGLTALENIVNHPRLKDRPFYIEEPDPTLEVYSKDIGSFKESYKD